MPLQPQFNKCRGYDNGHRLIRVCDHSRKKLTTLRDNDNIITLTNCVL